VGSIYKRRRHKAAHEGVARDSICVVKKAGILHNTENIARALAHARAGERRAHTQVSARNSGVKIATDAQSTLKTVCCTTRRELYLAPAIHANFKDGFYHR